MEVQQQLPQHRRLGPEEPEAEATCYADEHLAYWNLGQLGCHHATVCHGRYDWARDDDGDGIREVHTNTIEGFWTGLRNYLRTFRGVSKHYLHQYVAMYGWMHNVKVMNAEVAQAMVFTG